MEDIVPQLFRLKVISTQIRVAHEIYSKAVPKNEDLQLNLGDDKYLDFNSGLGFTCGSFINIKLHDFLENWNYLHLPSSDNRHTILKASKGILKPYIRELKKFNDLKNIRNTMLAHSSGIQPDNPIQNDNYPKYPMELTLVTAITHDVMMIISQIFLNEINEFVENREPNPSLDRMTLVPDLNTTLKAIRSEYISELSTIDNSIISKELKELLSNGLS